MDYDKLLEKGLAKLPSKVVKTERFEMPKVRGHIQGNKTIITNINQVVSALNRELSHFLKFLLKELATPGKMDGPRLVLGRKLNSKLINAKVKRYAEIYVLCKTCGKPDTTFIKKEGVDYLKCTACGAQHVVKL